MIVAQIALIILIAAPVLGLGFYLWFMLEEYARKKNLEDNGKKPSRKRRRR